jgi:hypothetical protein
MVTSQVNCPQLGTADTNLLPWREEGPFMGCQDVMGVHGHVRGLLLSNTVKIKRLEPRSYRQERNFINKC